VIVSLKVPEKAMC